MGSYARGLDAMGGRHHAGGSARLLPNRVLGFADRGVKSWDNHDDYASGDVVFYAEKYWLAVRDVTPPLFPVFQAGEVPGQSDAWREIQQPSVLGGRRQLYASTILGMLDIQNAQRNMNTLTPVTVEIAQALVKGGQATIDAAIASSHVKVAWYMPTQDLPGQTTRDNVKGHLQWHADNLKKIWGQADALYPSGDDLKKWTMQAFIEANAVEEGAKYLADAWDAMWKEINDGLKKIEQKIGKAAMAALKAGAGAASGLVEATTGVPMWMWVGGAALGVGLLGFVAYKVATGPVGGSMAKRYLP